MSEHTQFHFLNPEVATWPARKFYDVCSALRGPDVLNADFVKQTVITRLRAIVFNIAPVGYDYCAVAMGESEVSRFEDLLSSRSPGWWSDSNHFRNHILIALNATHDHPIWGGFSSRIMAGLDK